VMTLYIGMTCAAMVAAVCAGALAVSQGLPWLEAGWPWLRSAWWLDVLSLVLVIACLTYVMLVFGQLVPRAIAQQYPEHVLCWLARPLMAMTHLCRVVRTVLTASATMVLWLFGQRHPPEFTLPTPITEEEVTTMVRE